MSYKNSMTRTLIHLIVYVALHHLIRNFVKQSYQTASIPLYLLAQRVIKSTSASSYLGTRTFVAGFSEGGFGSVAVAEAVSSLGFETYLLTGGLPNLDTIQDKMIGFCTLFDIRHVFLFVHAN